MTANRSAAGFLENALLFNFVVHAVAMASMAVLLLPGMPGGATADDAQRVAYIAQHPWLWRLGWFPWQVTAFADLALGVALVRTPWVPRAPAIFTLVVTVAAICPDQIGQFLWITRGVRLAQEAAFRHDLSTYLRFERPIYTMVAAWGCLGYLCGALGWTWSFVAARVWNPMLTGLSVMTWGVFALATVAFFLPPVVSPGTKFIAVANAVGFICLQLWLIAVTEQVMRRSRPVCAHGRFAPWRHPRGGIVGRSCDWVADSRFLRALGERLATPRLRSDIRDVVYVNYLVEAERLEDFVPEGLRLRRCGPNGRYALFTFLTYRHGHLGPRVLGPCRRLLPSPIQSNWRIYVTDPSSGCCGIYFTTTAITSTTHALTARLLSEGVPMHVPARGELQRRMDGTIHILLDPGKGTAPDVRAALKPTEGTRYPTLEPPWSECFANYLDFLSYCVPQDRALSCQSWYRRVTRQEIVLGIPLTDCIPLQGTVESRAAFAVVGDAQPVCFCVPRVQFRFEGELKEIVSSAQ